MDDEIRSVLAVYARLPLEVRTLNDDDDLYQAGLTSHANVNVMLALEEQFGIEFPESFLRRSTFESIRSIRSTIAALVFEGQPGMSNGDQ
ncbi:MAG: acyl carrier protein [Acidimicrobiales bacterium]